MIIKKRPDDVAMTGVDDEDLLVKSKSASFSKHGIIPPMNTPVLLIIVMLYTGFK